MVKRGANQFVRGVVIAIAAALISSVLLMCAFGPATAQAAPVSGTTLTTAAPASGGDDSLQPGVYYIQSALSGRYMLDVSGASKKNGANAQIYSSNKTAAQRWRVFKNSDGTYSLRCEASKKYLDVSGGKVVNKRNVWQYAGNGSAAQKWNIVKNGAFFTISPAGKKGYALDVNGARARNGSNVQIYASNGTNAQKWALIPVGGKVPSQRVVDNGYYELRFAANQGYALDVSGASGANGANVQLYSRNSSYAQRWYVRWESDGYYSITNLGSGKVLDVSAANPAARTNVQQYASNKTAAQRWAISEPAKGVYQLRNKETGLALDVAGAKAANGTNVQTYFATGGSSQRFTLTKQNLVDPGCYTVYSLLGGSKVIDIPGASAAAGTQAQIYAANGSAAQRLQIDRVRDNVFTIRPACSSLYLVDSGGKVFQSATAGDAGLWQASLSGSGIAFKNVKTGRCLAVAGGKGTNGAKLVTASPAAQNAQRFRLTSATLIPNGYYELRSVAAGSTVLEVAGASKTAGANAQLYTANSTAAQAWKLTAVSGGWFKVENDNSGMALAVAGASKAAGANVVQQASNGADAQLWKLTMREGGGFTLTNKASGLVLEAAAAKSGANVAQGSAGANALKGWRLVATSSRALSGNAELDGYVLSIAKKNGYDFRKCFNWVTSNIRWTNSVKGEVLGKGIVSKQKTIDFALYAFRHHKGDCYYYASALKWLAIACGKKAEVRAGAVPSRSRGQAPHGWTEVYQGGTTYICDANLAVDIGGGYRWYMVTYGSAPVQYYK